MQSLQDLDWDHVRVFLGVMRSTSLRQAAELLRISHPTAARHLEALEEELGLQLFDRRSDGLHATPAAAELLEMAEQVESSVHALRRRAANVDPSLKGPVRVTAPDILVTHLLMPEFAAFTKRHPNIELDIQIGYELADLGSREADVAIRSVPHGKTPDLDLAGRKAVTGHQAIYGSPHQWLGWQGEEVDREWVRKTAFPDLPIYGRFPDPLVQLTACQAGLGLSLLPCFVADGVVERLTEPKPFADIWVLVHEDLRRSPRLRILRDEMVDALKRLRPILQGEGAKTVRARKPESKKRAAGKRPPRARPKPNV